MSSISKLLLIMSTFHAFSRLIHDRELSLFDGSRLLRQDRYDDIKEENGYTDAIMKEK